MADADVGAGPGARPGVQERGTSLLARGCLVVVIVVVFVIVVVPALIWTAGILFAGSH